MSILIDENTRVLIQGITGAQAMLDVPYMQAYGTRVLAGVTPGRGGQRVHGVPVYDSVAQAVAAHEVNATVVYVPGRSLKDAVLEAVEAGLRIILVPSESVPLHDAADFVAAARAAGAYLIGPNCNGLISPGKCKLGGIGGDAAAEVFPPGRVGVLSRSGGMSAEISLTLKAAGLGISTCVSLGGDLIVGCRFVHLLDELAADPDTDAVVLFGEPGTRAEQEAAAYLAARRYPKPVVGLVVGDFQERYPPGVSFGHFAALIDRAEDTARAKRAALQQAGVLVTGRLSEVPDLISQGLGRPRRG